MNKRKISIIGFLLLFAFLVTVTGCNSAGDTSSSASAAETLSSEESGGETSSAETSSAEESADPSADDAKAILGTWDSVWDMSGVFNGMVTLGDDSMGKYVHLEKLDFPMQFSFFEDGTYAITADEQAIQAALAETVEDLRAGYTGYFEYLIETNDLDMSVEAFLLASGYESMDQYLDSILGGFDETSDALEANGKWSVENGRLYVIKQANGSEVKEYYPYELAENQLKLTELVIEDTGEDGMAALFDALLGDLFPMVLARAE